MFIQQLPNLLLSLVDLRSAACIAISDLSTYATIPTSGNYSLQITIPGGTVAVNVDFTPGNVNVYKAVDLDITCTDDSCCNLPDGIYDVQYTVIPPGSLVASHNSALASVQNNAYIDQKFIKIDTIKCKYQKAFLKIDLECICHDSKWNNYMAQLQRIKLYIDGSVAACNDTNYALSYDLYQKANEMLDKMGCNKLVRGGLWAPNCRPIGCNIC